MIKKLNCCCFNNLMNSLKFVRFTNNGYFVIECIVQYTLGGYTFTDSATLQRKQTKKINLDCYSNNICLNILNLSEPDLIKRLIYHECISVENNICYEIFNTVDNPMITKTIC